MIGRGHCRAHNGGADISLRGECERRTGREQHPLRTYGRASPPWRSSAGFFRLHIHFTHASSTVRLQCIRRFDNTHPATPYLAPPHSPLLIPPHGRRMILTGGKRSSAVLAACEGRRSGLAPSTTQGPGTKTESSIFGMPDHQDPRATSLSASVLWTGLPACRNAVEAVSYTHLTLPTTPYV